MVFNSLSYAIFLPLVFLLFLIVKEQLRWLVLFISSYLFYGFILKPILLVALTVVITATFYIGKFIEQSKQRSTKYLFLWLGIIVNVAILAYFKYLPFLTQNVNLLFNALGVHIVLEKPLPLVSIGLSFYIFQAISYLADIYFRMAKPEQHFGIFALYLAFFPKLLQGPIERAGDFIPQLKTRYVFDYDNIRFGILLFAWGLFKKVVIADRLGLYVDAVYNDVKSFTGLPLVLATYAYAFQIFMDFSGYTDMALGSARLFNINLTNNFNSPYLATSIKDFWRRWHISLSRWILDYIFEPLQMKFRTWGNWGTTVALLVTFLLCGIWHGANWNYVIWGGIHGVYLVAAFIYKPYQKKLHEALSVEKSIFLKTWQIFVTFNLVCLAFVVFRTDTIEDAIYVLMNIFNNSNNNPSGFLLSQGSFSLIAIGLSLALYMGVSLNIDRFKSRFINNSALRWFLYIAFIFYIISFAVSAKSSFIYFGF